MMAAWILAFLQLCSAQNKAWRIVHPNQKPTQYSPTVRYGHDAVVLGDYMVSTHGYFYNHPKHKPDWRDDTWIYSFTEGWFREVHLSSTENPKAAFYPSSVAYNGKIYMFGGDHIVGDGSRGHTFGLGSDEVWELTIDPITPVPFRGPLLSLFSYANSRNITISTNLFLKVTGSWRRAHAGKLAMPSIAPRARACHATTVMDGKMYVAQGFDRSDLWAFDLEKFTWMMVHGETDKGPGSRFAHQMVAHHGRLWVYGGNVWGVSDKARSDLWSIDPATELEWRFEGDGKGMDEAAWPAVRAHHVAVYEAGNAKGEGAGMYITAGLRCPNGPCKCREDTWRYDFESGSWVELKADNAPIPRYSHSMVLRKDTLYVFGGESMKPYMYHNEIKALPVTEFGFGGMSIRDDL
uniref:Uncharacterized protein n=2 Tax=Lotharella globosa TaxID=91324 RepID=A0A7S3Z3Y3_9EUKA